MSDRNRDDLSRRDFMKGTAAMVGGFIGSLFALPSIAYLISPVFDGRQDDAWIDLGHLDGYPVRVPSLLEFTRTRVYGWERTAVSHAVFVVRLDAASVRVFSSICTHLGCHVNWHPDVQHYISPCHDGHFDVMGGNVSGPPPRPLDEFATRLEGGNLLVQLPPFKRAS